MEKLFHSLHTPNRFATSPHDLWTSERISPFIFQSYFTNDIYGGSKDTVFQNKSISFINDIASRFNCKKILDLGCGPGIYCSKLFSLGYESSGIDICQKAISYAQEQARNKNQNIKYYNNDILTIDIDEKYDMIIMLYEVFSTFPIEKRSLILEKVYTLLDENGIFIFDVPSHRRYVEQNSMKIWEIFKPGDIFLDETCCYFFSTEKFPQETLFNHSVFLFENGEMLDFYDWIQCFNKKMLEDELSKQGFSVIKFYSNTIGERLDAKSHSIAGVCQKN